MYIHSRIVKHCITVDKHCKVSCRQRIKYRFTKANTSVKIVRHKTSHPGDCRQCSSQSQLVEKW